MKPLDLNTIERKLLNFPDWDFYDNAIHAEFEFDNFKDCFSAMSRIAFECEALNHHPNWTNVYNVLTISLSTHSANGVTEKDFKHYILEHYTFLKRPVICVDDQIFIGNSKKVVEAAKATIHS